MKKIIYHLSLIAVASVVSYSNTFNVPFQFDDMINITENPVIQNLDNFVSKAKGYGYNPRRFVGYFSFAVNYHVSGLEVSDYHAVNLAVHIINAVLVYSLILLIFRTPCSAQNSEYGERKAGGEMEDNCPAFLLLDHNSNVPSLIALLSALLFVVHPLQTQAVTYIVQRFTSLAATFYLLSVVMYIKGRLSRRQTSGLARYILSLLFAILAMKTKEIAFTLPLVILMFELIFFRSSLKKKLLLLLPVLLTLVIIPVTIMGIDRPLGEILSDLSDKTRVQTDISRWNYLLTETRVVTTYIRLLFLPINQNLDYDYPISRSLLAPPVFFSFLFLVAIFGIAVCLLYMTRGAGSVGQEAENDSLASLQACRKPGEFSKEDRRKAERLGEGDGFNYSLFTIHSRLVAFGILWFFITLSVE